MAATASASACSFSTGIPSPYFNLKQAASKQPKPRLRVAAPVVPVIDWVMFDRRVLVLDEAAAGFFPAASSASVIDLDDGVEVRTTLYLLRPPSMFSRVPRARPGGGRCFTRSASDALADNFLLQLPRAPDVKLYVFTADPLNPTMDVLPVCNTTWRSRMGRDTGLLSRHDRYAVSFMSAWGRSDATAPTLRVSVTTFSSYTNSWGVSLHHLPVASTHTELPAFWTPDSTLAHNDCICWASYTRGEIIISDVLSESPTVFCMSLPPSSPKVANQMWKYKALAVSEGLLKFVDIDRRATDFGCHITLWSLDPGCYVWSRVGRIEVANCRPASPLFPLPSGVNADRLFFMISSAFAGRHQVYEVNWPTATLLFWYPYAEDSTRVAEGLTAYVGSTIPQFVAEAPVVMGELHDNGDGAYELALLATQNKRAKSLKKD